MSITERNKKLKAVFKYSDADLLMNRQEKVSESQGETLKSYRRGRMTSLIAFSVMFLVLGLVAPRIGIWILVRPGENVIRLAILGAMGFMMLMIAISSLNFYIQSGDILSGKVRQRQGTAQLYMRQYRDEYRSLGMGWFVKLDKKRVSSGYARTIRGHGRGCRLSHLLHQRLPAGYAPAIEAI